MFTWICPQCGREVPPSYSECPTCAENRQRAAHGLPPIGTAGQAAPPPQAPPPQAPPAPQPTYQPPAPAYPVQAPTTFFQPGAAAPPPPPPPYAPAQGYAPPQQPYVPPAPTYVPPQQPYAPPPQPPQAPPPAWQAAPQPPQPEQPVYTLPETEPSRGVPSWLVAILVAGLAIGGLFLAYKLLGGKSESAATPSKTDAAAPAVPGANANPYAKYIEVAGIRIVEDEKQQVKATFAVINHSSADLPSLSLQVTLRTTSAKPGDEPVAVLHVNTGALPANSSRDITEPLKIKLRAYELPDWQFLRAQVEFTDQH